MIDNDLIMLAALLVAGVGALNVGLVELVDTNLIEGVLGLTGSMLKWTQVGIGGAGAIVLAETVDDRIMG